ncbi:MAG TPA: hypothetical protein DDX40_05665 [Rikenellaceae bacterium]|nr:hypothetical protein [Rikenellaceae bacterium]
MLDMKASISKYFVALTLLALTCACNDYENPYEGSNGYSSAISLTKSDVFFSAAGGKGSIEVNAPAPISARTTAPWCHLGVEGMKVNVTVDEAATRNGRSAIIVLKCQNDSVKVTCIQKGFTLTSEVPERISSKNAGGSFKYLFRSNVIPQLSTSADWVSASLRNDSLLVTIQGNPDERPRTGWVAYSVGSEKDTIRFSQLDADKLIPGKYEIPGYLYGGWNKDYVAEAIVELNPESTRAQYCDEGIRDVVIYNVTFPNLIKTTNGKINLTPVVQLAYDPDKGYISWCTSYQTANYTECRYKSGTKWMYVFSSLLNTGEINQNGLGGTRLVNPRDAYGHYVAQPEFDDDGVLYWKFKSSGKFEEKYPNRGSFDGWGLGFFLDRQFATKNIKNFFFVSKDMVMKKVGDL